MQNTSVLRFLPYDLQKIPAVSADVGRKLKQSKVTVPDPVKKKCAPTENIFLDLKYISGLEI